MRGAALLDARGPDSLPCPGSKNAVTFPSQCDGKVPAARAARRARRGSAGHSIPFEAGFAPSSSPCWSKTGCLRRTGYAKGRGPDSLPCPGPLAREERWNMLFVFRRGGVAAPAAAGAVAAAGVPAALVALPQGADGQTHRQGQQGEDDEVQNNGGHGSSSFPQREFTWPRRRPRRSGDGWTRRADSPSGPAGRSDRPGRRRPPQSRGRSWPRR